MTLPQRIAVILKRSFAYLHPCLYGPVGGGETADLDAIASALRKEIEYLLPDADPTEVVNAFLQKLPEVRRILETDAQAAYEGDPAATSRMEVVMAYPGMYAVTVHRLAHELYRLKVPIIPRVMSELAHSKTGIDIHPGATIGERFFIDHGTGVVIGETTVIGNNVKVYQGVTLGAVAFPKDACGMLIKGNKRHPTIGNKVTIYSGASVLGDITIGDNSVIGGNVWLTESLPPGTKITARQPEHNLKLAAERSMK